MFGPPGATSHDVWVRFHSRGQPLEHLLVQVACHGSRLSLGAARLEDTARTVHTQIAACLLLGRCAVEPQHLAGRAAILVLLRLVNEPRPGEVGTVRIGRARMRYERNDAAVLAMLDLFGIGIAG